MASKGQSTGMRGVFLVAAELSAKGFIVSPTSRGAAAADLLITNHSATRSFSVQVKTNAVSHGFWLVGKHAADRVAPTYIYVLVNIRERKKTGLQIEYYIVPSRVVAKRMRVYRRPSSTWYAVDRASIEKYRDRWALFGAPV